MPEETQHFDGTVDKVQTDGTRVISSYLDPGEKLYKDVQEDADPNKGETPHRTDGERKDSVSRESSTSGPSSDPAAKTTSGSQGSK